MQNIITIKTPAGNITATKVSEGVWYYNKDTYGIYNVTLCVGCKGFIRLVDATDEFLALDLRQFWDNRFALQKFAATPLKCSLAVTTWTNWGNGWSWHESKHPKQPDAYLGQAMAGHRGPASFRLQLRHNNSMPTDVGYFATQAEYLPFTKK